jgi:hypothetical protein
MEVAVAAEYGLDLKNLEKVLHMEVDVEQQILTQSVLLEQQTQEVVAALHLMRLAEEMGDLVL